MSVIDFGDLDLNLFISLLRTADIFNKQIADNLTAFKISKPQFDVLYVISRSEHGRETLSNLVQNHFFSKSNLSSILTRLEKKNFIKRVKDKDDKRITWLMTTEAGEDFLNVVVPTYRKKIKMLLQTMPEEQKELFFRYLENMRKNLLQTV